MSRREELITDFTIYAMDHPHDSIDPIVTAYFKKLKPDERLFFRECYQLIVGSAEQACSAPDDVKQFIRSHG